MRLLLIGGSGQVGRELRELSVARNVALVAPSRAELDLTDATAVTRVFEAGPWGAVINAAAYTNVDRAESEESAAFAANAEGPARLAIETARCGIPLVHISTDYVFDGRKGAPYVEGDVVSPLNVYGRSKRAGEERIGAANPRHVILRTAWVYSPFGNNFVRTILRLAAERDRLTIVADQRGCPTAASDVARACLDVALLCAEQRERMSYGIYHLAGAGEATWYDFARAIIERVGGRLGKTPEVIPIKTSDYPTAAVRPADTRLDCGAIGRAFGIALKSWPQALEATLDRLIVNKGVS